MKTLKKLILAIAVLAVIGSVATPALAATDPCAGASENSSCGGGPSGNTGQDTVTHTPVNPDPNCNNPNPNGLQTCLKNNKIIQDLNGVIDFLSAGVAIVVIGSIILGGIQYTMAGGSPDAVGKAKQRITNALIAFAAFLFIFAFLQWIIPGGL